MKLIDNLLAVNEGFWEINKKSTSYKIVHLRNYVPFFLEHDKYQLVKICYEEICVFRLNQDYIIGM